MVAVIVVSPNCRLLFLFVVDSPFFLFRLFPLWKEKKVVNCDRLNNFECISLCDLETKGDLFEKQ